MKTKSPALAGQNETTCYVKKKSRDRPWIFFLFFFFFFFFFFVVLKYLSAGIISIAARLVWDPFSELTPKLGQNFSSLIIFSCSTAVFISSHLSGKWLSNPSYSLMFTYCWSEEPICFQRFHTCAEGVGPPVYFPVIFNYRSHLPVTGWPTTSALAWLLKD